jgi:hypothetical protein
MTGALEDVPATNPNSSRYAFVKSERQESRVGQLIDKHGHVHSEEIFRNWSPVAIKALGIHRVDDEPNSPSPHHHHHRVLPPTPRGRIRARGINATEPNKRKPNEYLRSLPV